MEPMCRDFMVQVSLYLMNDIVFRMSAPTMSRDRARRMVETYLMGRESSTLKSEFFQEIGGNLSGNRQEYL